MSTRPTEVFPPISERTQSSTAATPSVTAQSTEATQPSIASGSTGSTDTGDDIRQIAQDDVSSEDHPCATIPSPATGAACAAVAPIATPSSVCPITTIPRFASFAYEGEVASDR
jgi:hypothetical protein